MTTWTTKDGRVIPITEMSDDHVSIVLRMLQRKAARELMQEAERRKLAWAEEIDLSRCKLSRAITGALRDSINTHGPITEENISSAVKRIHGQSSHTTRVYDMQEKLLKAVAEFYAMDPTTAGLVTAFLPGKGYYVSIVRYTGNFGDGKEVVASAISGTLAEAIEILTRKWSAVAASLTIKEFSSKEKEPKLAIKADIK